MLFESPLPFISWIVEIRQASVISSTSESCYAQRIVIVDGKCNVQGYYLYEPDIVLARPTSEGEYIYALFQLIIQIILVAVSLALFYMKRDRIPRSFTLCVITGIGLLCTQVVYLRYIIRENFPCIIFYILCYFAAVLVPLPWALNLYVVKRKYDRNMKRMELSKRPSKQNRWETPFQAL